MAGGIDVAVLVNGDWGASCYIRVTPVVLEYLATRSHLVRKEGLEKKIRVNIHVVDHGEMSASTSPD